jgi:hypothetical protein
VSVLPARECAYSADDILVCTVRYDRKKDYVHHRDVDWALKRTFLRRELLSSGTDLGTASIGVERPGSRNLLGS